MFFRQKINVLFVSIFSMLLSLSSLCQASGSEYDLMMAGGLGVIGTIFAFVFSQGKDEKSPEPTPTPEKDIVTVEKPISFDTPGEQKIVVSNPTKHPIEVNNVALVGPIHGLTIDKYSTCQPIPPGGKCEIPITALANAYGGEDICIAYGRDNEKITTIVSVTNTQLAIIPSPKNNNIFIEPFTTTEITYVNKSVSLCSLKILGHRDP